MFEGVVCIKMWKHLKIPAFSSSTLYEVDDKTTNEINTSMQTFLRKYQALNRDEVTAALMVNFDDITDTLSKEILCVGCRRSVEGKIGFLSIGRENNY